MNIGLGIGAKYPKFNQLSLALRALSAIRRNGGTLIGIPDNFAGTYIDSTGTQPVTAVGDLVGLLTDRSYGAGNLGAEKVTNGDFSSGTTGWTFPAGWALVSGAATVTSASSSLLQSGTPLVAGRSYRVEFDWTHAGGTLYVRVGAGAAVTHTSSGRKSMTLVATTAAGIEFYGGAVSGSLDNISVREVLGNHATQPTTASKPVVTRVPKRLGPNLVVNGTFDANLTGWTNPDTAPSVTEWVSGQARMTAAAGGALARLRQQVPVVAGKTYQASVSAVAITGTPGAALALGNASSGDTTYGNIPLPTAGRFSREVTPAGSIIGFAFTASNAAGGTITLDDVEVREVLEWTNAISFDGSNDFLQTGITTGNEGWMAVGVKHNAAVTCYPAAAGGLIDSMAGINLRLINGVTPQVLACDGTLRQVLQADANITQGDAFVNSCGWDGSTLLLGVNNTEKSGARTRNPTASLGMTIGAADGTGAGVVNGSISAVVRTPVLPSAADRALIRRWIGSLQGQTL